MPVILQGKDKKGDRVVLVTGGLTLFNSGPKTTGRQGRCSFARQKAISLTGRLRKQGINIAEPG